LPTRSVNEDVIIRLKWGDTEYKGTLVSVDSYMNVQLHGTEEFIDGKSTGSLGQVLIRYVFFEGLQRSWEGAKGSRSTVRRGGSWGFIFVWTTCADLLLRRCNNVLWISAADGKGKKDVEMAG
jgi:small nuclear ribonucleoprotein (snRNP)-like protein